MRTVLLSCLLFVAFFFSASLQSAEAEESPFSRTSEFLHQDIYISFDPESSLMLGRSALVLPPERELRLSFAGLQNVQVKITETGSGAGYQAPVTQEVTPNSDNILLLAPTKQLRTLSMSWQVVAPSPGISGNLISSQGITLTALWHPTTGEKMRFTLNAELPLGFSGVTEADEIDIETDGMQQDLRAISPHPVRAIHFAAGPYSVLKHRINNITLYSYFFAEDEDLAPAYLEQAAAYIQRYEDLIGPFPYQRYSIVENRLPSGYGMPGFALLGQSVVRLPFIKDTSLGHEILHSWFGNAIDNGEWGNWCEGLTTLLADQSYAEEKGNGAAYRKNQLLRYQAYVGKDKDTVVLDFQNADDSRPMSRKMQAIGYDRVSMLFHTLRREIGDEAFFVALRETYKNRKYSDVGWSDLENAFTAASGRELSSFFSQWLSRPDIPLLTAEQVRMKQKGDSTEISFHIVQHTEQPYRFRLPVIVRMWQETIRETVAIQSIDQKVTITVPGLPTEIIIDPEYDLMRTLDAKERPPVWMQFIGAERKTAILPEDKKALALYLPLTAELEQQGCRIVRPEEIKNSDLSQGSFLFLGSSSHSRELFGVPESRESGFSLDVRKNPLNPDQVMVLISSASAEESSTAFPKLAHYGKYSRLLFQQGEIKDKQIAAADNGIRLPLLKPPVGIPVPQVQDFSAILKDISQSKVIYAGETHTDYGDHLLQLQILQALQEQLEQEGKRDSLVIGMEMFPRSSQAALDSYINGAIRTEQEFLRLSAYYEAWGYDYRMYRDIINYAKAHRIPVIGLNLNKEIVSKVFNTGSSDELTPEQRSEAALYRDLDMAGYRERLLEVYALHKDKDEKSFSAFLQAQALWDETMAESIASYLQAHPEKKMLVLAGTGHVYKDNAVPPRVARRLKCRQSVLIANDGQVTGKEQGRRADYLMFTENVELPPAGKIGVLLSEEKKTASQPSKVEITAISPVSKADEAGLQKGDVILTVDSTQIAMIGDLKTALLDKKPGETVQLTIVRKDKILDITVELSDMEKEALMPPEYPKK